MQTLQTNSLLQGGRYKILSSLGKGGFGITYLALQCGLERKVAIKEFFMKELCERDESTSHVTLGTESSRETVNRFRDKFLKEARNIAKLNHPNIVRIHDIFEENGTAYYVMEYAENGSLAEKVKKDGYLSEPVATRYILQVAEALNYLHHQKMNHLDVKPANIMLNEKDETVLIDFGLSKQYDAVTGNQTSTTPVGISDGYAPIEQYKPGGVGEFSPQTDIYALGATFFKLLTGTTPPSASDVIEDGVPVNELKSKGVSQKAIDVICKAMEGLKKNRMKEISTFIDSLRGNSTSEPNSTKQPVDNEATLLTAASQKAEEESKRKEDKAERNAHEEVEQEKREKEEKASKPAKKSCLKKLLLWIIFGIILIFAIDILGSDDDSSNTSTVESPSEVQQEISSKTYTVNGVSFDMMYVKGGTFTMGEKECGSCTLSESELEDIHQVSLAHNFYIGKTEVSQSLWKAVMGSNPSFFKGDNKPVESVSWDDCKNFILKLNALTGQQFRLPTEAEWEFAARGGNNSRHYHYSGSNELDDVAWYHSNSRKTTHDVSTKQPNELGIYDMSGNVWEWCSDSPDFNASYRIYRGGCSDSESTYCHPILSSSCEPDRRYVGLGFRLALSE